MEILAQFLLRLAFGLGFGMAITSPRQVSSGYFRNHLYVTLGLATLAALVLSRVSAPATWFAVTAAVLSYVGAVCWLYEAAQAGRKLLWLVAASCLTAALVAQPAATQVPSSALLSSVAVIISGLVLGVTMAAMLLGHWYLNAPGMELAPLRKLIAVAGIAIVVKAIVSGIGLAMELAARTQVPPAWMLFILLRWSFGILGVAGLLWMARETLKIPNTQSATGILYVAVIGVFVGELTAALLSAESAYPL
jgi:hypothetical protein